MAKGKWKPGESGNPQGRKPGSSNKVTHEMREAISLVVGEELKQLPELLNGLEPEPRLNLTIRLMEFILPKLKGIEVNAEFKQVESPLDLGELTFEERKSFYALYKKANHIVLAPEDGVKLLNLTE